MFQLTNAPQDPFILQLLPIMTQACDILREEYQAYCAGEHFDVIKKSDNSPVTQADVRVHHYLMQALTNISTLPILSEEGEQLEYKKWHKFWLLDPLDGTKEFLHQRDLFTINLSIVEAHKTIFAILAIPMAETLYICPEQGMPLKYDIQQKKWWIYTPSTHVHPVHIGLSHSRQAKTEYTDYLTAFGEFQTYDIVKAGSAYKFCMILEDQVDIYPRFHPTYEWDTSAGQCLLERIGGGVMSWQEEAFTYNQREKLINGGFLAYRNEEMKQLALQAFRRMMNKH